MTDALGENPFPFAHGYFKRLETVERESAATIEWMKKIEHTNFKERLRADFPHASGLTQGPELAMGENYVEQCRHVIQAAEGKFLDGCKDIFDLYRVRSPVNDWLSPTELRDIENQIIHFLSTERLQGIEAAACSLNEQCGDNDPALRFSQLRTFAQESLKGMQSKAILILIEKGGRYPIPDLAVEVGTRSESPRHWWNDVVSEISPKILKERLPWGISTHDSNAVIEPLPVAEK